MPSIRRYAPAMIPAVFTLLVPVSLWLWARFSYVAPAAWESVRVPVTLGALLTLFLAGTLAVVVWVAAADSDSGTQPLPSRRGYAFLGLALVADFSGILLAVFAFATGNFSLLTALKVYLLLIAWLGVCAAITWTIRPRSPALAVVVALAIAAVVMSSPVTAMPLVRASAGWGPAWQPRVLETIACSNPFLALIEALRPDMKIEWAQLPQMYQLSGLGQDIPLPLLPWWVNSLTYGGVAVAFWAGSAALRHRFASHRI